MQQETAEAAVWLVNRQEGYHKLFANPTPLQPTSPPPSLSLSLSLCLYPISLHPWCTFRPSPAPTLPRAPRAPPSPCFPPGGRAAPSHRPWRATAGRTRSATTERSTAERSRGKSPPWPWGGRGGRPACRLQGTAPVQLHSGSLQGASAKTWHSEF